MIVFKKAIPRRAVLRGIGATLALPLLDSMVPAFSAFAATPAKPINRLGVVYVPNGMIMQNYLPSTEGPAYELTPTLSALAPDAGDRERVDAIGVNLGDGADADAQRHHRPRLRGSKRSRRPSPRRFAPSRTHAIAAPGMNTYDENPTFHAYDTPCASIAPHV